MLKFTGFLTTSPVWIPQHKHRLSDEQSTLEGVQFSPSIMGRGGGGWGGAEEPQAPPLYLPLLL